MLLSARFYRGNNWQFLLENALNLTHKVLYDKFNKIFIQKLMWCIFTEKWFNFFFKKKALRSEYNYQCPILWSQVTLFFLIEAEVHGNYLCTNFTNLSYISSLVAGDYQTVQCLVNMKNGWEIIILLLYTSSRNI